MEKLNLTASICVATSSEISSSIATPPGTPNERQAEIDGSYYSDSECRSGDEELNDDDIEKAYQDMYSKWIKLWKTKQEIGGLCG